MSAIRRALGHLRRRTAASLRAWRDRHRPDFRDERLDTCVRNRRAQQTRGQGATDPVAEYFRTRREPRWFVEPADVASLARRFEREHPDGRTRLLEQVSADSAGLAIYARQGPPLDGQFPWGTIEPGPGSDPLYPVRPHRFAFLPRLALASHHESTQLPRLHRILTGWMQYAASRDNRYAYSSNLVVIQRVLACSWAWALVAGHAAGEHRNEAAPVERLLLSILQDDIGFLTDRLGDSVPNNHLLADRFASWFIALAWPELDPRDTSAPEQVQPWLDELNRQVLADGTSFEHSTHYHALACEMLATFVLLQRCNGAESPPWVHERLRAMLRLQLDLRGRDTAPVAIGDGVEDPMIALTPAGVDMGASWTAVAASVGAPVFHNDPFTDAGGVWGWWMLGGHAPKLENADDDEPSRHYPLGGIHVLHGSEPGTKLIFRTGPASGTEVVAGHMHADILGVYLFVHGMPCVVDPGTYSYRLRAVHDADPPLAAPRLHLTGPRAHNGVTLGECDPLGTPRRDFRTWATPVRTRETGPIGTSELVWIEACLAGSDAYEGLSRGVIHVRGEYWLVYDIPPDDGRSVTRALQLADNADVESCQGLRIEGRIADAEFTLVASNDGEQPEIVEGRSDGGWISPCYGELVCAPQIRLEFTGSSTRATAFVLGPDGRPDARSRIAELDVEANGNGVGFRVSLDESIDYLLVRRSGEAVTFWEQSSSSRVRWIRTQNGRTIRSTVLEDP